MKFFKMKKSFSFKTGLMNVFWVIYSTFVSVIIEAIKNDYAWDTITSDARIVSSIALTALLTYAVVIITSGFFEPKVKGA